jgi:hypothetical protein
LKDNIGNRIKDKSAAKSARHAEVKTTADDSLERKIKQILQDHLIYQGWKPEIVSGAGHGIDIDARRGKNRWIIQIKGTATSRPMLVNHFLSVLGEIAQRMDDPDCKYSIALLEMEQYHRLWERLPQLAKSRLQITALFVNLEGSILEET